MAEFKGTSLLLIPRVERKVTPDTLFWDNLTFPVVVKEVGQIDYIDFSPSETSQFVATCSSRIQLYNTTSAEVIRTFSKFRYAAYGGKFRSDGNLLISGSDEGVIRLFDVKSRSVLRSFKGHSGPTHRCDFNKDGTKAISFSDDKSAILWDIPAEKQVVKFSDCHTDYIRAGLALHSNQDLFLSGSYDHSVSLLDSRTGKATMSVDHGSPVESLLVFPAGGVFISAGGCMVKVWSIIGKKLLAQMVQHHKTVTSLCFAKGHERLLSGSLDRHVKIYDTATYQVVHTLDYPSPILSIAVSGRDKVVVAGMADGLISIRCQQPPKERTKIESKYKKFYRYQVHGMDFKQSSNDLVIEAEPNRILAKHDHHLRRFESTKALDAVLKDYYIKRKPYWTVSVMQELIRRGTLMSALAGRNEESLEPVIRFILKHILDPKYTRVLMDVTDILITVYTPLSQTSERIQDLFKALYQIIEKEIKNMEEIFEVQGALEAIMAASNQEQIQTLPPPNSN